MDLILNLGLAWVSLIVAILLSTIYILRKAIKKAGRTKKLWKRLNRFLRKYHKILGLVLIGTGLIHGLFSSESVWTLNLGTVCWVFSILLGLNWLVKKQLSGRKGWMFYHRFLTITFIVFIVLHIVDVGIQAPQILIEAISPPAQVSAALSISIPGETLKKFEGVTLKDGVYQGEANGYRLGLMVEVTVENGSITSIQILEHHELNSQFYTQPLQEIPQAIIDSQSLDVDTIAGATKTSVGIINAVNAALTEAVTSGTLAPTETTTDSTHRKGGGNGVGRH